MLLLLLPCLQMKFCWFRVPEKSEGCIKHRPSIPDAGHQVIWAIDLRSKHKHLVFKLLLSDGYIRQTQIMAKSIRRKYQSRAVKGLKVAEPALKYYFFVIIPSLDYRLWRSFCNSLILTKSSRLLSPPSRDLLVPSVQSSSK